MKYRDKKKHFDQKQGHEFTVKKLYCKIKSKNTSIELKHPNYSLHASESNALITDRLSTRGSLTQLVNCHEESWVGHSAIGPELQYIHTY